MIFTKQQIKEAKAFMRKHKKEMADPARNIHYAYHKLCDKFVGQKRVPGKPHTFLGKKYYPTVDYWKLKGYALMKAMERFAKKYPDYVELVSCDDDYHAGSMIALIKHQKPNEYFGTTLLYIPQCTGEDPIRLFLYDGHRTQLINALKSIAKAKKGKKVY